MDEYYCSYCFNFVDDDNYVHEEKLCRNCHEEKLAAIREDIDDARKEALRGTRGHKNA